MVALVWPLVLVFAGVAAGLRYNELEGEPYTVGYTSRGITINGTPTLLLSGKLNLSKLQACSTAPIVLASLFRTALWRASLVEESILTTAPHYAPLPHSSVAQGDVHYARTLPEDQTRVLAMLAGDGLNTVQTYAFWSLHEPSPSVHEWGDNPANVGLDNVTGFLTRAAAENLFVSLRIGPFICGEWSYGGIPAWVNKVDSMVIRTHNAPWENATSTRFTRR